MKYSYSWLKELSGTTKTSKEIVDAITMHSFEVEEMEKFGSDFEGVVVGEILEIQKHPNADKLQLTKVKVGKEILDIVCGAHNISVGDHVPVATVGTKLPVGIEIKEAEIRGEKSFGMLCAVDELGLGTDHSGILLLDKSIEIGTPFGEIMGGKDEVLEIKILPDRAHDALSHVGMAREIAALEGREIDYDFEGLVLPKKKTNEVEVKIEDGKICPRYIGAIMKNVEVSDSPQWMKNKLQASGIRPINNVVDATNFVMLELGQPLHAFDFDEIKNQSSANIIARRAKDGEEIKLLDESVKKLTKEDIVIANEKEILALAGIMGGLHSGISENTKAIVLEAANFDATTIRKTRTRLNVLTDSALRFEKAIDPNLAEKAMVRVIEILQHTANGELEGVVDDYKKVVKPWNVKLDLEYASRLLGVEIPSSVCRKILESLDMKTRESKKILDVQIPTYRIDLKTQEDLIEEIGRINGYDKIAPIAPKVYLKGTRNNEQRSFERSVKNVLVGQGFSELYNYSFYGSQDLEIAGLTHLELETPLSPDQVYLRTSLVPNVLKNVKENLKNFKSFQVFELGRVYLSKGGSLPEEKKMLAGAVVSERKSAKLEKQDKRFQSSFFEAKSYVDAFLHQLGIIDHYFDTLDGSPVESPKSFWHPTRSAEIKIGGSGKTIGFVGEVSPVVLAKYGITSRVAMFEFDFEKLMSIASQEREYAGVPKYPIVVRDISMLTKGNVKVDEILQTIQDAGTDLIQDVDLFDAIDFADDATSYAFHVILGAKDRTLTSKEIDDVMENVIARLEKDLKVEVRK